MWLHSAFEENFTFFLQLVIVFICKKQSLSRNLLLNFLWEEPLHSIHFKELHDQLHSVCAAYLSNQVDTVPVVPAAPAQVLYIGQEGSASTALTSTMGFWDEIKEK